MKTSNKFTLSRVILSPIFFLIYYIPIWTGLFSFVSVFIMIPLLLFMEFTDYLDGHFARKHNEVSDFGKIFDPFADVIVHLTTFSCLIMPSRYSGEAYLPIILFILVMYREFSMMFLRMTAMKKGVAIAARKGGKFKTVLYVVSGFFALGIESVLRLGINIDAILIILKEISSGLFILAVIACYISFIDYIIHFKSLIIGK